jgi:hypothetical protein
LKPLLKSAGGRAPERLFVGDIMVTLRVTMIGSAEAVVLGSEAKALLGVKAGDLLQLTRTAEGTLRIAAQAPECERERLPVRAIEIWRELLGLVGGLGRTKL